MYRSRKVMAIGAHPDDVEFGCSGTLCNHINNGDYVVMVVMTNIESVDGVTGEILRTKEELLILSDNVKSSVLTIWWLYLLDLDIIAFI